MSAGRAPSRNGLALTESRPRASSPLLTARQLLRTALGWLFRRIYVPVFFLPDTRQQLGNLRGTPRDGIPIAEYERQLVALQVSADAHTAQRFSKRSLCHFVRIALQNLVVSFSLPLHSAS